MTCQRWNAWVIAGDFWPSSKVGRKQEQRA